MNMEESSEIKRKQNRLTIKQGKTKEKEDKADSKKTPKKLGKVDEKGQGDEVEADGHGHDEGPPLKKPKRKLRKPTAEEDIIDGFAILAFKNYDELTRAIKLGENSDSRLCVQLLRRAEDGSVCKSVKEKKTSPKAKNSPSPKLKSPKPNSTSPNKKKETPENMANKLPGSGSGTEKKKRKSESAVGNSKKKQRPSNGATTTKENLHTVPCETVTEGSKLVSDGCTDLFAPTRKDSSPYLLDNLHSPHEPKGLDPQEPHINHDEEDKKVRSISPFQSGRITPTSSTSVISTAPTVILVETKPTTPPQVLETSQASVKSHTNGSLCLDECGSRDVNGHAQNTSPASPERSSPVPTKSVQQTLFTPYATSAITRVNTGGGRLTTVPDNPTQELLSSTKQVQSVHTNANTGCQTNSLIGQQSSLSDFTLSGSHIHRSSQPSYDKTGTGTGSNLLTSSLFQRNSTTPTSKESSSVAISKSTTATAFGSIARLLDSPNPPTSSRNSPITISASATLTPSTNDNNSLNQFYLSGSGGPSSAPQSCSSRSLSPRSHSPPRERDSYSSNVSSLSRTSVTPVSGSSSLSQLPPNLSPLQSLSYSKAASWLSGVPPRLSPVPRPTPPPILPPSSSGHLSSAGVSSLSGATPSPLSVFPGLVPGHTPPSHGVPPPVPISGSAMFAPPMLPLSSIMSHPSTQSVPFGPSADNIFPGQVQSELVRRDLESRFLGPERIGGSASGPGQFLSRTSDLHSHHQHLLSHLSAVNSMSPHNQPGTNPALFPPPMFKELKLDSPLYRNMLSYPGFNGMLPPPPNLGTPFTSPSQMPSLAPKKTGKWNAMHVRIAWEIYQHQQKGGSDKNSSNALGMNSSQTKSTSQPPTTSHSSSDLLRPPNHLFSGLSRPPDIGPPPFVSPLLSPHQPPHRVPFDPTQHPLFLHATQHLGPSLARYPGFGALGPSFSGLSGLGSSLLGRDLTSLNSLANQEQWQRMQRGAPLPTGTGQSWPLHRPDHDPKAPTEARRLKEDRSEKRYDSDRHSESKGGSRGDSSPFRDRSPVRPSRTPLENGDTDSRSSRSNDSHSTTVHGSKSRYKDESNGDREKSSTPQHHSEKDRDKGSHVGLINDMKSPLNYMTNHPARMFHSGSPMAPMTSGWESFPGFSHTGPRMSSVDSFRLGLLQLSERDKEYSARIQSTLMRPHYPNGPFMNMPPLGGLGQLPSHPQLLAGGSSSGGSNGSSSNSSTKSSPLGGPNPLLNHGQNSLSHHQQQLTLHHHSSSQNGCGSPSTKSEDRVKDN